MKIRFILPLAVLSALVLIGIQAQDKPEKASKPALKALLVAGGCCHDYKGQHAALFEGIQARANVQVDVVWTDDKSVNPPFPHYDDPNWADGYDVIIHDECAAGNKDLKVLKHILDAHKTVPAVHLHCAMHSFRNGTDQWFKHLGLKSTSHGPQAPIKIEYTSEQHPILAGLEGWTTGKEELYNNAEVHDAKPLALGKQMVKGKEVVAIVAWTNETSGAPSFSTSIGHNTFTVEDPRYLDLVTRGMLWSCGKLTPDYLGVPFTGANKVTFVPAKPKPVAKAPTLPNAPKDATLVKLSAKSVQSGNDMWHAIDGKSNTRWCANGAAMPSWLQLEFEQPTTVTSAKILWEKREDWYQYKLETSKDGKTWDMAADQTANQTVGDTHDKFEAKDVKFFRVTMTRQQHGMWPSIRELKLTGPKIKSVFPKMDAAQVEKLKQVSGYEKSGNIPAKIAKLTKEEEAGILKQVKVPEGFDVSVFSSWQAANYPVYVAAAPNGDLYVASDGNGSLGRESGRGRVLRLRDTDKDGRADQVTPFIENIDSPRGLVWDHDRLYVLHPPHISVYFDKDRDGIAEDSKKLIDGIAFGFKDRPADHTTNGLDIGIDGWLYIAGGDFGFMKATGTDGRELQHRGGGVIRFRPDGSGLELFSTGTRNILGTPISPTLDIFARDNTNDGGGWDVRFHHFTGLEDHGYPRLYKNFPEEHIHPLADYGGGSGCGSMYLSEPGYPAEWNNAPMTCDWGTGALWKHSVEPIGATFKESKSPEKFISVPRPTDADVDGFSNIYQASWKGPATFKWAGPDTGFIVKVSPSGYKPEPLPDFDKMNNQQLIEALKSPSHVRRLTAQRALVRRSLSSGDIDNLLQLAGSSADPIESKVAALYAAVLSQPDSLAASLKAVIDQDSAIAPFAARALGDINITDEEKKVAVELVTAGLKSDDSRRILESIISAARQNLKSSAPAVATRLDDPDPAIGHAAFQALAKLNAHEAAFAAIESKGAAFALMRMHTQEVVDGCVSRLANEKRSGVRQHLISVLARLYYKEAEWNGSSWGTRPDTRGPYYELATWQESEKILSFLKSLLETSGGTEVAYIVKEMNRNRIQSNEALQKIITMAKDDPALVADAVAQIASTGSITTEAIPLLLAAAANPDSSPATLAQSLKGLSQCDDPGAVPAMLKALVSLDKSKGFGKEQSAGRDAFLKAPKLENHHLLVETLAAENFGSPENIWANAGLLALAERKKGSPESREMSQKAIDTGWQNPQHKIALLKTIAEKYQSHYLDAKIPVALHDPSKDIASAAQRAAKRLKLQLPGEDKTPQIATLKPADAIAQITAMKSDVALGESVYARANCTACHTTNQDEKQKGPYLGNIAQTYNRQQLAEAIIEPNKTIAQGFKTNVITLKSGAAQVGFVTDEAGDTVTIRDIAANEHTFAKDQITKRDTLPTSMMPPGLVNGFSVKEIAGLLGYLEKLSK